MQQRTQKKRDPPAFTFSLLAGHSHELLNLQMEQEAGGPLGHPLKASKDAADLHGQQKNIYKGEREGTHWRSWRLRGRR